MYEFDTANNISNELLDTINSISQTEMIDLETNYFSLNELNDFLATSKSKGKIIQINIRSLKKNFNSLKNMLNICNTTFEYIALSETWLTPQDDINFFKLQGYNIEYINRKCGRGGGVLLYINNNIDYKLRTDLCINEPDFMECVTVETCQSNCKKSLVMSLYKAPNINMHTFNEKFDLMLQTFNCQEMYLCGDFNINLLKSSEQKETNDFVKNSFSHGFFPIINKPTRIQNNKSTLIDNIWTNSHPNTSDYKGGILISDISDHLPTFMIDIRKPKVSRDVCSYFARDLSEMNINLISDKLSKQDWNLVMNDNDTNKCFTTFHSILMNTMNQICPVKQLKSTSNRKNKAWLTSGLKNACLKKNRLYKIYIKQPNSHNMARYKSYKNKLTSILRAAESNYFRCILESQQKNLKDLWKTLNVLLNRKTKQKNDINRLKLENQTVTNKQDIANAFNNYFSNIGLNLAKNIKNNVQNFKNYLKQPIEKSMFLFPTSEKEIFNIVMDMKSKSSCDIYDISMSLLKKLIQTVIKPLSHIFNLSLSNGIFPNELKVAKVIPLFKKGEKSDPTNYRPISLLPQISKILEKLFYKRLISHIEKNNILSENQYGFRSNHNTTYAIIDLVESINNKIKNDEIPIGIFIDLQKAFDTIDHGILKEKLFHYGIRGIPLDWINSYLHKRSQLVYLDGHKSKINTISCGVPQGSILGPLLFIIYINDIANCSQKLKFLLFADDTNIIYSEKYISDLKCNLEKELVKLDEWFKSNKLSLNLNKTSYINFSKSRNQIDLYLNNTKLKQVSVVTFLGIQLNEKLNWNDHIKLLENKLIKNIRIMNLIKNKLDTKSMICLYHSLILPNINYCLEIWGNSPKNKLKFIEKIQKRALRMIFKLQNRENVNNHFKQNNFLKLNELIDYSLGKVGFKANLGILPANIQSHFNKIKNVHNYETRSKNNFYTSNKDRNKSNIIYNVIITFNKIPDNFKNMASIKMFNRNYKTLLLSSYHQ
jgi:hypothetical protein